MAGALASKLERIKTRPDFLRVAAKGRKWAAPGLILQVRPRTAKDPARNQLGPEMIRVGFTCSRKVGGAVERNRAKRRLRAVVDEIMPAMAKTGCDYVVIGRRATIGRPFDMLKKDLVTALRKTGQLRAEEQPS